MTRSFDLIARITFAVFGAFMLMEGIADALAPRASYRQSHPEPASVLATAPTEVIIHFTDELTSGSTIHVVSTVSILPSGEWSYSGGENVVVESGLDPNDPSRQSLRAGLRPGLPHGLYRVDWSTVAARGRTERSGCYYFGAGMPVPASITRDLGGSFRERDADYGLDSVSPRAAGFVGILLIALAILLPWLRPYRTSDIP